MNTLTRVAGEVNCRSASCRGVGASQFSATLDRHGWCVRGNLRRQACVRGGAGIPACQFGRHPCRPFPWPGTRAELGTRGRDAPPTGRQGCLPYMRGECSPWLHPGTGAFRGLPRAEAVEARAGDGSRPRSCRGGHGKWNQALLLGLGFQTSRARLAACQTASQSVRMFAMASRW